MALGAGRRIVRQLLTEAVVLSLLGASLGVLLAQIVGVRCRSCRSCAARLGGIVIDARVMAFCLGLSLVSTLLIGLVPALRVGGAAFGEGLALHAGETRTTGDRQGERLRTLLVAGDRDDARPPDRRGPADSASCVSRRCRPASNRAGATASCRPSG